jgi:hypothetical protein
MQTAFVFLMGMLYSPQENYAFSGVLQEDVTDKRNAVGVFFCIDYLNIILRIGLLSVNSFSVDAKKLDLYRFSLTSDTFIP